MYHKVHPEDVTDTEGAEAAAVPASEVSAAEDVSNAPELTDEIVVKIIVNQLKMQRMTLFRRISQLRQKLKRQQKKVLNRPVLKQSLKIKIVLPMQMLIALNHLRSKY